jgi:PAS domain S-box-containing protein
MDVLNELPQKVFLKDGSGRMVLANQNVADTHGLSLEELIGKTDFDFVDAETARSWREQEFEIMRQGEEALRICRRTEWNEAHCFKR